MNKLVLSALAATVCVGTTNASEGDWAGLDSELSALTTSMVKDGPSVGGYLEATYDTDGDIWGTGRNRVTVSGDNGGYGYHGSLQGSEGADAYITFTMGGIGWTMGDFRAPGTSNHLADENDTTFMYRDAIGGGGAREEAARRGAAAIPDIRATRRRRDPRSPGDAAPQGTPDLRATRRRRDP